MYCSLHPENRYVKTLDPLEKERLIKALKTHEKSPVIPSESPTQEATV
jgi:hypothetical protein